MNNIFNIIIKKTDNLINILSEYPDMAVSVTKNNKYTENLQDFYHLNQWTHSFLTGIAGYLYLYTKDEKYLAWLNGQKDAYRKKVFKYYRETMHDLGFLYSLYAVALYKISGDTEARETALRAADELCKRFHIKAGIIQAWGHMDNRFEPGMMICDCMMNLPLLFWAHEETKHPFYRDIAVNHANAAMKYLVREDYSVRHAFTFDDLTGEPLCERNYCGYSLGSAWARGAAWMLYGFAIAYSYTKKALYKDTAHVIASFFIANLPEDFIPFYDFKLPEYELKRKDTSAAAVAACGLFRLCELDRGHNGLYKKIVDGIFENLSSEKYLTKNDDNCQQILNRTQCGDLDAGAIWGDYFYVELASRLNGENILFW
jgi:unsaturated chondroitin disaccharide hydrolase